MVSYHSLTRRELQALCKQHKIPANKTNVFMADALTTLLGNAANKEATVEEAPLIAMEDESVGEVSEGTVADDASKPVANQAVKKRIERCPAKKKQVNIPEDLSSAVKPATRRASLRSKVPKLADITVDAAVKETSGMALSTESRKVTQEKKATASRKVSPVLKQNAVKQPAKMKSASEKPLVGPVTASSDKCSTQPESDLTGPCLQVAPLSAEKNMVANKPVDKEAQGGGGKEVQDEKLTVGAMPEVATNTDMPSAAEVQAAVKAKVSAIGKVKIMVSQFEKELSGGSGFSVDCSSEKQMDYENVADVVGGTMLPDVGDIEIHGEVVDEVLQISQTTIPEPTKNIGRTKKVTPVMKKGVKAKLQSTNVTLSPVQASSPVIKVYNDLNVEEQKLTAEKGGVSKASDAEISMVPMSPVQTELQNSELSLPLVKNEQEKFDRDYPHSPLAQSPAGLQLKMPINAENGGSLFDQENSVMKTENVPQSLRKLRKQVKEKISKVGKMKGSGDALTAAQGRKGAPLKEMSLNVLSGGRSVR